MNAGILGACREFDKFPFGLLTMVVSLEAIFLATFVMVTQIARASEPTSAGSQLEPVA